MSTVRVRRRPRRTPPPMPAGEVLLEPPPELPQNVGAPLTRTMLVLPVLLAAAAMSMVVATAAPTPLLYLVAGLYMVSQIGVLVGGLIRTAQRPEMDAARRDYLRYLGHVRGQVRGAAQEQRAALEWSNPRPGLLWAIPRTGRLWERRPSDPDFAEVRVGTGRQDLALRLVAPQTGPVEDLEPLTTGALRRFGRAHATVSDLPYRVRFGSFPHLLFTGEPPALYALARSMIMQLATFHAPGDLRISLCVSPERTHRWDWVKWLPHAAHPSARDAAGPLRLIAPSLTALEELHGPELAGRPSGTWTGELPFHLVILDGGHAPADSRIVSEAIAGVCVLDLTGSIVPDGGTLRLDVTADRLTIDPDTDLRPDHSTEEQAEALARQLAPLRLDDPVVSCSLADLIDVDDLWSGRRLTAPIGVDETGDPVDLDCEAAPHTLVVGDGHDALVESLVLGLALTQSPDRLTIALLTARQDAYPELAALPHVSAQSTGLAADPAELERLLHTLRGELARRENALRHDDEPETRLLLVVDGFPDLEAADPEVGTLLTAIGRSGAALGVHLLLAAARLTPDALPAGLDAHLGNRIALRTFSAEDSEATIGTADAHALPRQAHAYLHTQTGPRHFHPATLTQKSDTPAATRDRATAGGRAGEVLVFTVGAGAETSPEVAEQDGLLGKAVAAMRAAHRPVRRLVPRPLSAARTLDELGPAPAGGLRAVIGRVDRPLEQRREPYVLDLTRRPGNVGVVGRQGAGKTALLRAIVAGLALGHEPGEVVFHLGGSAGFVDSLAGLPHVTGVTPYDRPDPTRLADTLRDALWRIRTDGYQLLVIDDWPEPRGGKALAKVIADWADGRDRARLVVSAPSWIDLPSTLRRILDIPLELRLDNPRESRIDGRLAGHVPPDQPGRGLTPEGLHFLAALPRNDGMRDPETTAEGLAGLVEDVRERHLEEPAR